MIVNLGEYMLDINVEETEKYYKTERYVSEGCKCDGCENFELAVEQVSNEVKKVFKQLGIDIKKPAEVYVNCSKDNILFYGGFYHLCGEIKKGGALWRLISETEKFKGSYLDDNKMFYIDEGFRIAFQEECSLLNENFPQQCFQMEVLAYLPWVLQKQNRYEH